MSFLRPRHAIVNSLSEPIFTTELGPYNGGWLGLPPSLYPTVRLRNELSRLRSKAQGEVAEVVPQQLRKELMKEFVSVKESLVPRASFREEMDRRPLKNMDFHVIYSTNKILVNLHGAIFM